MMNFTTEALHREMHPIGNTPKLSQCVFHNTTHFTNAAKLLVVHVEREADVAMKEMSGEYTLAMRDAVRNILANTTTDSDESDDL